MFAPTLPSDLLVNVYINLNKLCLTVYQLHALQPTSTKVKSSPSQRPTAALLKTATSASHSAASA